METLDFVYGLFEQGILKKVNKESTTLSQLLQRTTFRETFQISAVNRYWSQRCRSLNSLLH